MARIRRPHVAQRNSWRHGTDEGDRRAPAHRDGGACLEHVHDVDSRTRGRRGDGMEPDRAGRDRHGWRGSLPQTRSMAIVQVSVHDSVNAITREYETYLPIRRQPRDRVARGGGNRVGPLRTDSPVSRSNHVPERGAHGLARRTGTLRSGSWNRAWRSRCGGRAVASCERRRRAGPIRRIPRRARGRRECGWPSAQPRRFFRAGAGYPRGCCGADRNSGPMVRRHSTAGDTHATTTRSGRSDRSRA